MLYWYIRSSLYCLNAFTYIEGGVGDIQVLNTTLFVLNSDFIRFKLIYSVTVLITFGLSVRSGIPFNRFIHSHTLHWPFKGAIAYVSVFLSRNFQNKKVKGFNIWLRVVKCIRTVILHVVVAASTFIRVRLYVLIKLQMKSLFFHNQYVLLDSYINKCNRKSQWCKCPIITWHLVKWPKQAFKYNKLL